MVPDLSPSVARHQRLRSHLLGPHARAADLTPAAVVDRAVALQGQHLPAVLRAIAIRSAGGTSLSDVRAAFDRGDLVRSWPVRGTLFATTPRHLRALLTLTSARTLRAMARRADRLGLSADVMQRSVDVALDALGTAPRTRADLLAAWEEAGIATAGGRGYHLIVRMALGGRSHWGRFTADGREQLLELTPPPAPGEDPAEEDPDHLLAEVVVRLVGSRGPLTEADLAWWTKLPVTAVRRALAASLGLVAVLVAGAPAWVAEAALEAARGVGIDEGDSPAGASRVVLAPAFDEWILGYADRSLIASPRMLEAVVPGGNGMFRPVVLVDGVAVGTWSMVGATVAVDYVEAVPARTRRLVERAAAAWPHG